MLTSNNIYGNVLPNAGLYGIYLTGSSGNLLTSNSVYGNQSHNSGLYGIYSQSSSNNNFFISDYVYGNTGNMNTNGVYTSGSTGNVWVGGDLGYSTTSVSSPDSTSEVVFSGSNNLTLKKVLVNPTPGISTASISGTGSYVLNYSTGVLRVYGDYMLSGSTLTLDYANELYASTATTPLVMIGTESGFVVNSTSDTYAVSQLVTMVYNGPNWTVTGSSTGFICNASGAGYSCGSPVQFTVTMPAGNATGDTACFGLIAGSQDQNTQKVLYPGALSGFNNGRSKIEILTGAGFDAEGTASSPTIITELANGGTYYTFVDSGAFTVNNASFTYMDESGIQLFGGAGPATAPLPSAPLLLTTWARASLRPHLDHPERGHQFHDHADGCHLQLHHRQQVQLQLHDPELFGRPAVEQPELQRPVVRRQ